MQRREASLGLCHLAENLVTLAPMCYLECEGFELSLLIFHILGVSRASAFTFNSLHAQVEKDGFMAVVEFH